MNFNCSKYNSKLTDRLENVVKENRVSHAYIFEGPRSMDKAAFARAFIKGVLCPESRGESCGRCSICHKVDHDNYEDLIYVEKDGLSVKDAAIEKIQEKLNIKPLGDRNVVVIKDSDTMTLRAQNRLLKTLEEPPGDSLLILLSENIENLAQTILSRCVKYRIEGNDIENADAKAEKLVEMILDASPVYEIFRFIDGYLKDKDKSLQLMDEMEHVYIKLVTEKKAGVNLYNFDDIYDNIHDIEEARKQIQQGMSASYALKNLVLRMSM